MSAGEVLRAVLVARLEVAVGAGVRVFDAPPVRAARPHVVIDEPVLGDWGAKGVEAREFRVAVRAHDAGERPVRLRGIGDQVEAAMRSLPRELGDGWGLASVAAVRVRMQREGGDRWVLVSEWRVRMLRSV